MSNSMWIVDEYWEWIHEAVYDVKQLYDNSNGTDKDRLYIKLKTLEMARDHFEQLYGEGGNSEV